MAFSFSQNCLQGVNMIGKLFVEKDSLKEVEHELSV